ncbi:MAG TPA: Crp/Fnr family transcriptional regulator [Microvirga sp.]|jgi:hypothetical protein|nr:Crp/Fnr family transcriptional regulator [Microvirga sp.]
MTDSSLWAYLLDAFARLGWPQAVGTVGLVLVVAASATRTMIPLRALAVVANLALLAHGWLLDLVPALVVNAVLLPLNLWRLGQMLVLVRRVRRAARQDLSIDWLKPFMSPRSVPEGEVLFRRGEEADCLYYTLSGRFCLRESGREIGPHELVGELGFLTPDRSRTQTLECRESGAVLVMGYDDLAQLYHQNPNFGFSFLNLTSGRLLQNLRAQDDELMRLRAMVGEGQATVAGRERAAA